MIRLDSRSLRRRLLVGASLGSLIVAGAAEAQNRGGFGSRGGAGANPTAAVTQAIQAEVGRATQASSASQTMLMMVLPKRWPPMANSCSPGGSCARAM